MLADILSSDKQLDGNATDIAIRAIWELIVCQDLLPGERTSVIALSDRLGLSRAPVKEAITRLAAEGVFEVQERRGTFVAKPDEEDIRDYFALRRMYEDFAASLAVKRISDAEVQHLRKLVQIMKTESVARKQGQGSIPRYIDADVEFHMKIVAAASNRMLLRHYNSLSLHLRMASYFVSGARTDSELLHMEHSAILRAVEGRDGKALQAALRQHASRVEEKILNSMAEKRRRPIHRVA